MCFFQVCVKNMKKGQTNVICPGEACPCPSIRPTFYPDFIQTLSKYNLDNICIETG